MAATKTRKRTDSATKAAEWRKLNERLEEFVNRRDDGELSAKALATVERFTAPTPEKPGGRYSERNALLIAMQCPGATELHKYGGWMQLGRHPRLGTRGIRIVAGTDKRKAVGAIDAIDVEPGTPKTTGRMYFDLISVFDISQTDPNEPNKGNGS